MPTTKYRPLLVCSRLSQRSSSSRKSRQKNPKSITKLLIKHGNGRRTDTPALFLDAVVLVAFPHQKKNSSREESGELLEHEHEWDCMKARWSESMATPTGLVACKRSRNMILESTDRFRSSGSSMQQDSVCIEKLLPSCGLALQRSPRPRPPPT